MAHDSDYMAYIRYRVRFFALHGYPSALRDIKEVDGFLTSERNGVLTKGGHVMPEDRRRNKQQFG